MRDDQVGAASRRVERRVVLAQRAHQDLFEENFRTPNRVHHARDQGTVIGVDRGSDGMELEAERLDERAVELRNRQDRPMAAFLEREGEADIRVDVAVGPPTGDQDAERTGGVHKLSRILYNAAPRETP